jgi:hypothetical protein
MREIPFPPDTYNPVFVTFAVLLWIGCLASLLVPRMRALNKQSSLFFKSNSPMGRGNSRAATMRTFFLFCVLSAALVPNLHLAPPVGTVLVLGFVALAALSLFVALILILLNKPAILAPKSMREQPGAIQEWVRSGGKAD